MNDAKHNKMTTALGHGGQMNDLEVEWLQSLNVAVTSERLTEAWIQYLDSQAISGGTLDDRQYKWLGSLGHTGTLNDRWKKFWES